MYIDLAPFLNPSPYVVPEDMSLTKVIFSVLVLTDYHVCLLWYIFLVTYIVFNVCDGIGLQSFPPTRIETHICCSSCISCYWCDHQKGSAD